jgi:hypothetical protein
LCNRHEETSMSSVWTKTRKQTPGLDCGFCGLPTCAIFARRLVAGMSRIEDCPILSLREYREQHTALLEQSRAWGGTEVEAPAVTEDGVVFSKPCSDNPDLLMAEMRISNGVPAGEKMRFGVLDPTVMCQLTDCLVEEGGFKCSPDLAYAWGDLAETKTHVLRDGRIRMRRAKGQEHALEVYRLVERTVMGALICNCCGCDLLSILAGLAPESEEGHPVLRAGLTINLREGPNPRLMTSFWREQLEGFMEKIHAFPNLAQSSEERASLCTLINRLLDPGETLDDSTLLNALAIQFFTVSSHRALLELSRLVATGRIEERRAQVLVSGLERSLEDDESTLFSSDVELTVRALLLRARRGLRLLEATPR